MVARERRQRAVYAVWVAAVTLSAAAGLMDLSWAWLAAALASARAVMLAMFWLRLRAARRDTTRTGRVTVLAAVCPTEVYPPSPRVSPSWDEMLVGGRLEVDHDGWRWRPGSGTWVGFRPLDFAREDIVTVSTAPAVDSGMPTADYVQVTTRDGRRTGLLIWDYMRVPPIRHWPTRA